MEGAQSAERHPLKISVITVAYAAEDTIGATLDSVAMQDHPNIEHIVIDGASPDGTLQEVAAHQHPNLHVISEPDRGLYFALNKGIAMAKGSVIGCLHADDLLAHPRVLSRIAAGFAAPEIDAIYGDLNYVARGDPDRVIRHWQAGAFHPNRLGQGWMPPHPTLYLRREAYRALGGYDTSFRIAADYEAILRLFGSQGLGVRYLPEVLVRMRVGGMSNASLGRLVQKSSEDFRALRRHRIGGLTTLARKNLSKLPQFVARPMRVLRPEAAK